MANLDKHLPSIFKEEVALVLQVLVEGGGSVDHGGKSSRFHSAGGVDGVPEQTVAGHLQSYHPCCTGTSVQPDPGGEGQIGGGGDILGGGGAIWGGGHMGGGVIWGEEMVIFGGRGILMQTDPGDHY